MSELQHFNWNHDPKSGQFTYGDGDRDGVINDHLNQRERRRLQRQAIRSEKKDERWAKRNYDRLYKKAYKPVNKDMKRYVKKELNKTYGYQLSRGEISRSFMNEYNRKLAELMNEEVANLPSAPSGRAVQFVAKRGDLGVYMALADPEYDMSQVEKGIYDTGRVAYRKNQIDMV